MDSLKNELYKAGEAKLFTYDPSNDKEMYLEVCILGDIAQVNGDSTYRLVIVEQECDHPHFQTTLIHKRVIGLDLIEDELKNLTWLSAEVREKEWCQHREDVTWYVVNRPEDPDDDQSIEWLSCKGDGSSYNEIGEFSKAFPSKREAFQHVWKCIQKSGYDVEGWTKVELEDMKRKGEIV